MLLRSFNETTELRQIDSLIPNLLMRPLYIVLHFPLLIELLDHLIWLLGNTEHGLFSLRVLQGVDFGRLNQFLLDLGLLI